MAIFGKPVARQPYGIAPYMDQLNTVQQYGGPVADPRAGVMMQAQDKAMQPKAFEKGGKGWQVLGVIGDALQVAGGGRATYADAQRWWQEQEAERERQAQERQDRMNTPTLANLGNGGLATWSQGGGLNVIREPQEDAPDYAPYASMFGAAGTPEYIKAAQDYVLRGYGPTALGGRVELKQTIPGKAPSLGGGGGSGGISATARAKYIAEAKAAIAKGAPRDKVEARLREMGVM